MDKEEAEKLAQAGGGGEGKSDAGGKKRKASDDAADGVGDVKRMKTSGTSDDDSPEDDADNSG